MSRRDDDRKKLGHDEKDRFEVDTLGGDSGLWNFDDERKIEGVVTGQVINPLDPTGQGRVQVRMHFIDSLDLSAWARVATPMAGKLSGMYFIPNLGDEVLVAFEHGDINSPYIIGSLWSLASPPPLPSPLPQVRMIRSPLGNQIIFTEVPPGIAIQTASLSTAIEMVDGGTINIRLGQNVINVSPLGITLTAGTSMISLTAEGVRIVGPMVFINS
jgi:hypothetical protein